MRLRACTRLVSAVVSVLIASRPILSQPTARALPPANASSAEEFVAIRSVRELSDVRLLVTDWHENRLVIIDWRAGTARNVGAKGQGPGEYESPYVLVALPGDSTLMSDGNTRQWFLIVGDRIVSSTTAERTLNAHAGPLLVGADHAGRVLATPQNFAAVTRHIREMRAGVRTSAPDSLYAILGHRSRERVDTIARLLQHSGRRKTVMPRTGGNIPWVLNPPLDGDEQAVMFSDGWIAFARRNPYRIEWRRPDGTLVRGGPIPVPPIPVDDREKRALIARRYAAGGKPMFLPEDFEDWPRTLPPFLDRALLSLPDGRLVVWRTPSAATPGNNYDIIDRTGRLVERLALPANERLVGFGARSAYVVVKDDDDVERLRRHPWP